MSDDNGKTIKGEANWDGPCCFPDGPFQVTISGLTGDYDCMNGTYIRIGPEDLEAAGVLAWLAAKGGDTSKDNEPNPKWQAARDLASSLVNAARKAAGL